MKIGIIGAGYIAEKMATTLGKMEGNHSYAIAARDLERAEVFAERFGFEKAFGSYEEMVLDSEVELIYIATPHSYHYEHAKLCLQNGKNVLCEKPFTVNAKQAKELIALAKEEKLMITEAIWPGIFP